MKLISHRGNTQGKTEGENKWSTISRVLGKYDVEIDLWFSDKFYLGHDSPCDEIDFKKINVFRDNLWIHCKNIECFARVRNLLGANGNYFFHKTDDAVLTSKLYLWTYPGFKLYSNSIAVLPETTNYSKDELATCAGICSDFISNYD